MAAETLHQVGGCCIAPSSHSPALIPPSVVIVIVIIVIMYGEELKKVLSMWRGSDLRPTTKSTPPSPAQLLLNTCNPVIPFLFIVIVLIIVIIIIFIIIIIIVISLLHSCY